MRSSKEMSSNSVGCDRPDTASTGAPISALRCGKMWSTARPTIMRTISFWLGVGEQALADHLAVAKHRVAVGDAVDLIELVADEQDRLAFAPSGIRSSRKSSSISLAESAAVGSSMMTICASIDMARATATRCLLAMPRSFSRASASMWPACIVSSTSRALAAHGAPVDRCRSGVRGAWPRKMFSATERSSNSTVSWWMAVMPCSKAACALGKRDGVAADADLAGVRLVDAGQDFDQRRLAGAVLADQRRHLARDRATG